MAGAQRRAVPGAGARIRNQDHSYQLETDPAVCPRSGERSTEVPVPGPLDVK